jgi:hypothetical protein
MMFRQSFRGVKVVGRILLSEGKRAEDRELAYWPEGETRHETGSL